MSSTAAPPIAEAVAALRDFVKMLTKRPDVQVTAKTLGRPAPAALLAHYRRHELLPAHVLDFYALMNGGSVAWEFRTGDGHGGLRIPALQAEPWFGTDDETANDFGPGKLSAWFDQYEGEQATWLVADGPAGRAQAQLLFAEQGEGDAGFVVAATVADYLTQAVAGGLVHGWQWARHDDNTAADVQEALARLRAPAVAPAKIRPGVRVAKHNGYRGEVLQTYRLPEELELRHHGSRLSSGDYALVRFDFGQTFWVSAQTGYLKALPKKPDLYEQLYADPWLLVRAGEEGDPLKPLRLVQLAFGPTSGYMEGDWQWAGCLRPLPVPEAVRLVRRVLELAAPLASQLDGRARMEIPEAEHPLALQASDWRRHRWQYYWTGALTVLLNGLITRIHQEEVAQRLPVPAADYDALEAALTSFEHLGQRKAKGYGLYLENQLNAPIDLKSRNDTPFYHAAPVGLPAPDLFTN